MYSSSHSYVIGFHGCDATVAKNIISGKDDLQFSENDYDWLGLGIYFWEYNEKRAIEFAEMLKRNPERTKQIITKPAVVGAVIHLGLCLNLLESKNLKLVKEGYSIYEKAVKKSGREMPKNKSIKKDGDLLYRNLDRAVIETTNKGFEEKSGREFDSIRGVFVEGKELYKNAGFNEKNHIQICIRNPNCIKGYFEPRNIDTVYPLSG